MIRSLRPRSAVLMLPMALVVGTLGNRLAPTTQAQSSRAMSPVKVMAKEINSKYVFGPVKTKVKVGQAVVWKNTTDAPHTVTSTSQGWTYDKKLNTGASLRYTFMKTGTFHYKCLYHPGMVVTLTVTS